MTATALPNHSAVTHSWPSSLLGYKNVYIRPSPRLLLDIIVIHYIMFRSQSVVFGLLNLVLMYCITGQLHAEKEFTFLLIVLSSQL